MLIFYIFVIVGKCPQNTKTGDVTCSSILNDFPILPVARSFLLSAALKKENQADMNNNILVAVVLSCEAVDRGWPSEGLWWQDAGLNEL